MKFVIFISDQINLVPIVRLSGCPTPGFYGESCSIQCPQNCQEGRCQILDGTCLGCVSGYTGQICDKSK